MKIIGLGNPIMGDDGLGIYVIKELKKHTIAGVELVEGGTSGIGLLRHLKGEKEVIIVDAIKSGSPPGTIHQLNESDFTNPEFEFISLHEISLSHVLALGKELFPDVFPENIVIYGVEVKDIQMGMELSEPVKKALPRLVELLRSRMEQNAGTV